jgi:signal transduction histidine kinase
MTVAGSPADSGARPRVRFNRGWLVYAMAWMALAVLWSLASAMSSGLSPRVTLPYGLLVMGAGGTFGLGVWWLTGRLPWDGHTAGFYAIHAACMSAYAFFYTAAAFIPDLFNGKFSQAWSGIWRSPVLGWSILMGSWLYLIVAGLSYALRAQQRLQQQAAAEAEARVLAHRAQLGALRARLNPHFLFNALHTVSSLVTTNPAAADEAIERLGGLLRYALDESEEEVPLESEWAFTRDYLAFERLRLGDRLRTHENLEPDAMAVDVPLLVLQPIVENAIRHAIAPSPAGGTIRIGARIEDGSLNLSVEDDGPGVASPDLAGGQGIGLRSLKRRLEVRYGPAARMDIRTAPGAGFSVTVVLPAGVATGVGAN